MRVSIFSAIAFGALALPTALAEAESEARSTITITIPPIAEAMEAEASGANGAWTISSQGRGFMVGIVPEAGDDGGAIEQLAILSGPLSRVNVRMVGADESQWLEGDLEEADGALRTYTYALPPREVHPAGTRAEVLFSAI